MVNEEQVYQLIQESQEGKRNNSGLLNHRGRTERRGSRRKNLKSQIGKGGGSA